VSLATFLLRDLCVHLSVVRAVCQLDLVDSFLLPALSLKLISKEAFDPSHKTLKEACLLRRWSLGLWLRLLRLLKLRPEVNVDQISFVFHLDE